MLVIFCYVRVIQDNGKSHRLKLLQTNYEVDHLNTALDLA